MQHGERGTSILSVPRLASPIRLARFLRSSVVAHIAGQGARGRHAQWGAPTTMQKYVAAGTALSAARRRASRPFIHPHTNAREVSLCGHVLYMFGAPLSPQVKVLRAWNPYATLHENGAAGRVLSPAAVAATQCPRVRCRDVRPPPQRKARGTAAGGNPACRRFAQRLVGLQA